MYSSYYNTSANQPAAPVGPTDPTDSADPGETANNSGDEVTGLLNATHNLTIQTRRRVRFDPNPVYHETQSYE
ncbi:hypothetical protein BJ085DRAFT_39804, partial [Dimargaris cristalligena]